MNHKIIAGAIIVLAGAIVLSVGIFFLSFAHPQLAAFVGIGIGLVILVAGAATCLNVTTSELVQTYTTKVKEQFNTLKETAADPRTRRNENSESSGESS